MADPTKPNGGEIVSRAAKNKKPAAIFAGVVGLMLVLGIIVILASKCERKNAGPQTMPDFGYDFVEIIPHENIYTDASYLSKDRLIYYATGSSQTVIDRETPERYDAVVLFFCNFIDAIISGDSIKYNSFFSDEYIKASGAHEPFTMQKVYDIILTKISSSPYRADGFEGTKSVYTLEYKIKDNNGTFRRDIGSDMNRTQYISVLEVNGRVEIEGIFVYY